MLAETAIQEFTHHVRGEVLCSADEDYEVARQVFNAMIDKRPALIARCAGAADVIECVRFAREHDLTVSVRGGGHSVAGKAVCDDGLMIDLSRMKGIRVDPARRTVRAEAGLTLVDIFAPTPYVDLQRMLDEYFPPGRQNYWKSNFLRALSDEAIDAFVECADQRPVPQVFNTAIWLEHMHGVAARVGVTETAFPHRQHAYNFSIFSIWPDPAQSAERMAWTRDSWELMQPFMTSGTYVNYLEEEGDPAARSAYGVNYERLVALKTKYDPTNFFRINHNIRPTV